MANGRAIPMGLGFGRGTAFRQTLPLHQPSTRGECPSHYHSLDAAKGIPYTPFMAILFLLNALVAVGLIILILLQRTDAGAGGAFGGGSAGGQVNIRNPLAKPTAILAAIFLVSSLVIAMLQHGAAGHGGSVVDAAPATPSPTEPVPALPEASLPGAAPAATPATDVPATQ